MRIRFTKMQGAGNDFVVLDETRGPPGLTRGAVPLSGRPPLWRGRRPDPVGAPVTAPGIDFEYVIHNADGGEVEHCGNGARCFVRYVREQGLTDKDTVRCRRSTACSSCAGTRWPRHGGHGPAGV
jgi:diaminopimelate epimerase